MRYIQYYLLLTCALCAAQTPTAPHAVPSSARQDPITKPRVLIVGKSQFSAATTVTGGAVSVGRAVVGGASGDTVYTEHSETWEAMRRFTDECKGISMVTNPAQPHDFTVVMDYEKISTMVLGKVALYQLATLKPDGTPVLITKKNYLRRLVKPTCEAIVKAASNP